jgi:succinyl-CoA synthetase alpha subunit
MLLNEHQSKRLFAEAGLHTPNGILLRPCDLNGDLAPLLASLGEQGPWFCKAQAQTGGRGKAGGILRAERLEDVRQLCEQLLAMEIKGHKVPLVRVEPGLPFSREFYLSLAVSRKRESLVLTAGAGGVDVENLGPDANRPLPQNIDPRKGLSEHQIRAAFFHLFAPQTPDKAHWPGFRQLVLDLHAAVSRYGLLLAEINPLVLAATPQGERWIALDGKVEIDDNVRDLRPELERFYQPEHATPEENTAREAGLSFVTLKGWVGLLVNGAGLAMATMDLLNFSGLPAANFMDLGGAADEKRMRTALELLFVNEQVGAVFLNLFGGIVSCEAVARALRDALDGRAPAKPLVVRMAGNQAEAGRAIIAELGHPNIHVGEDMSAALEALERVKPATGAWPGFPRPETPPVVARTAAPHRVGESIPLPLAAGAKILVQGITGRAARSHAELMRDYGSRIIGGVTPFKGGEKVLDQPVYNSVHQAMQEHPDLTASIIFVPAAFAADAILEAAANAVPWIVCITEGIPQQDMLAVRAALESSPSRLVGPNTPGVIVPGQTKIGIMPAQVFLPGPVAVFSRSGTLTYETAARLSAAGLGQSICVGVGGDPFVGVDFVTLAELVRDHEQTRAVVVLGEIGGTAEEALAAHVRATGYPKPILSFIAGRTAPEGRRLGHAGAILEEGGGGIETKLQALSQAGIRVCPDIAGIADMVREVL